MKSEIESEIKFKLNETQYDYLTKFTIEVVKLNNYYFAFDKQKNCSLRIRSQGDINFCLTLKKQNLIIGAKTESTELSYEITKAKAAEYIQYGINQKDMQFYFGIAKPAIYEGILSTLRSTIKYDNILADLDKCKYLGVEDYEIECEQIENHESLSNILKKLNITEYSIGKAARFFAAKKDFSHHYDTVLFDLDGTLLQTDMAIIPCLKEVLEIMKIDYSNIDLYSFIGPPLTESFTKLALNASDVNECTTLYRSIYESNDADKYIVSYSGIVQLISALKSKGLKVGVTTSKPTDKAVRCLSLTGIYPFFDFIAGADIEKGISTKLDVLEFAEKKYNLNKQNTILIGDTKYDLEGAAAFGIDCIGVLYGYGKFEDMFTFPHIAFADTPLEVGLLLKVK
ncbi:MAG: HAD hydrolase-like protein [Clostridia bacterium]